MIPEIERVILLRDGRVLADGAPAQVLTSAMVSAQYGVSLEVVREDGRWRIAQA